MERLYRRFLGVDLGGGKGKTTAVARLEIAESGALEVVEVGTSGGAGKDPWYDENLIDYLGLHAEGAALAIDAPLTTTACVRCRESVCPGMSACVDPAVIWFRTQGAELIARAQPDERDQIVAIPVGRTRPRPTTLSPPMQKPSTTPYTQRACEVYMHRVHGIMPRETLGQGMGPLTARAAHLTRALARFDYKLNRNLLEVYPKATIAKLWGEQVARRYKRRAGTWEARAGILEALQGTLEFARGSRMAREQCLQNDHCFDAVICAYTAFLWARDGWQMPEEQREVFEVDGWIWAPP